MLSYYFSRLARAMGFGDEINSAHLQRHRQDLTSLLYEELKTDMRDMGCKLRYGPMDSHGVSKVFITHRNAPKVSFMYQVKCEWSSALEAIGSRAAFRIHSPTTQKKEIFYFGTFRSSLESDSNRRKMVRDAHNIAKFLTAEATRYAYVNPPRHFKL